MDQSLAASLSSATFFFKTQVWDFSPGMALLTTGLSQHLDHCHQSSNHANLHLLSVYPSRLPCMSYWPQGLRPLPHSSTDTGESTQWIWAASSLSKPWHQLTAWEPSGAWGGKSASQELPVAAAWGQDLRQGTVSMGGSENPQEINSSLKVGACSKGCRANWKADSSHGTASSYEKPRRWFYLEFAEHLVHLKDCPEIWSHGCFHLDEAAPLVCTSHPGQHCLLELANVAVKGSVPVSRRRQAQWHPTELCNLNNFRK